MIKYVYKICSKIEWANAKKDGIFIGSKKDLLDGFIHFSKKNQVKSTLKKYFLNKSKLILLKIDISKLNHLIFEKSSNNNFFPHLYCSLNLKHVKKTYKIILKKDGQHILPYNF